MDVCNSHCLIKKRYILMKNYQFEEITFWLSLIACLLAYNAGILWIAKILVGISVINLVSAIVMAWIDVKRRINNK
nr:MAG TPA: hypothetical protein [Caudoviricetes sp.]